MSRIDSIGVLTSGGDAQGMNAAVRAVVRTALHEGIDVYAIYEGYLGMVEGGPAIKRMTSRDVGGILQHGGTSIGTARSTEFRTRDGRRRAAKNLVDNGIDALVVIGGDGSLTGANTFRAEWPELLDELVRAGELDRSRAKAHPHLRLVGLVGSIDNDMFGTDMTIGADSALHRITEAIDAIQSTAASHQRSFVIEVMGRNCGYLALMAAISTGANWVFVPEHPPTVDHWPELMKEDLAEGRRQGRRTNMVVVAEGAQDRHGQPITADQVKDILEDGLSEDTRVTILGHVQRGGAPSAFDRNLSTRCGYRAVHELLGLRPEEEPKLVGIRENRITASPLMEAVDRTQAVANHIEARDYDAAMRVRGSSFIDAYRVFRTLVRARPESADRPGGKRIAVIHGGGPAPGMNAAVRAAVRLAMDRGHQVLGVRGGFPGLLDGHISELEWMTVSGWVNRGGAELGTSRVVPEPEDLDLIADRIRSARIDAMLVIGGFAAYEAAHLLHMHRKQHRAFDIPIVCLPATINNDVPASDLSLGSDTALNNIVGDVDKIKQTAVASRRCFVVEVMGRDSGYLALLSGLATGAEQVYLPEHGITLDRLRQDVTDLTEDFRRGQSLGLVIRGERADPVYTTPFLWALFEKEGGDLFDVRQAILGHVQQGGDPSPFDRIQATRLTSRCIDFLVDGDPDEPSRSGMVGLQGGKVTLTPLADFPSLIDENARRPARQPWLELVEVARVMSMPGRRS